MVVAQSRWMLVFAVIVLVWSADCSAQESGDTLFAAATRAFKKDDYELALQLFLLARQRGMNDARLHYNTGVTQFKLQLYEQAYRSLQQASLDPEFSPLAHINMGLAAAKLGELKLARRQFKLAKAEANNSEEQLLATNMLRDLAAAGPLLSNGKFSGVLRTEIGRNDNVILENANYTLKPEYNDAENYAALAADISKPLTEQIILASTLYSLHYDDDRNANKNGNNDFAKADLGLKYTTLYDIWGLHSGYTMERNTFQGADFQNIATFNFNIEKNPLYDSILGFDFRYARIQHYNSDYSEFSGTMLQLEGRTGVRSAQRSFQFMAGLEDNNRDDYYNSSGQLVKSNSATRFKTGIQSTLAWFNQSTIDLFLQYQISEFKGFNIVRNTHIKRKDDRLVFQMELLYPVARQLWLSAKYRHLNNDSTIVTYTYTSNNTSTGLVWRFR